MPHTPTIPKDWRSLPRKADAHRFSKRVPVHVTQAQFDAAQRFAGRRTVTISEIFRTGLDIFLKAAAESEQNQERMRANGCEDPVPFPTVTRRYRNEKLELPNDQRGPKW